MPDSLTLTDLELWVHLGVTEEERSAEQLVRVSLEYPVDASAIAEKDSIKNGIDYDAVRRIVQKTATGKRATIERLAEDIAAAVLASFPLPSITVTIEKYPVPNARAVSLTITRTRG